MKMRFFFILSALFVVTTAMSQVKLPKVLLAFHGIGAVPVTDELKKGYNFGTGAEAEIGFGIGKTLITGSLGYLYFNPKDNYPTVSYIPARIGARRYLLLGLFVNGSVGYGFANTNEVKVSSITYPSNTNSLFHMEGGIGYKFLGYEIVANYGGWQNKVDKSFQNSFLLKLGYAIKL